MYERKKAPYIAETISEREQEVHLKVLAYIVTFNDADVMDDCLRGVFDQTYAVSAVLVVDNASTDGSDTRDLPEGVVRIRHSENRGTNGSAITAFQYAIDHEYDWIWVFDADSSPKPDALEKLLDFYSSLSHQEKDVTWLLASLPIDAYGGGSHHGIVFTESGYRPVEPDSRSSHYPCDATMWTGSLYKVPLVRKTGLPDPNFVLDWGDIEYGYLGMRAGLKAYIHQESIVLHNLHVRETLHHFRFGRWSGRMFYSPPIRCYYAFRNTTYFWLHEYHIRRPVKILAPHLVVLLKYTLKAAILLRRPIPVLVACLRGLYDGLLGRLHVRY